MTPAWLTVVEGKAPLIISLPHTGTELPPGFEEKFVSPWLARKDADWWIEQLYDCAQGMGVTLVRTALSRSIIDVNRDPSGVSLYPGQATTELCPSTTFDGEPLYNQGMAPDAAQIALRREAYFEPYHAELQAQIARLRQHHPHVVLYDCHSIRSVIPRLFEGELPHLNIGTNSGQSCAPALAASLAKLCTASSFSHVLNGRFKGGYITRQHGNPAEGIHTVQMELACRGYMREPEKPDASNWPTPYDPAYAAPMRELLLAILKACLDFTQTSP